MSKTAEVCGDVPMCLLGAAFRFECSFLCLTTTWAGVGTMATAFGLTCQQKYFRCLTVAWSPPPRNCIIWSYVPIQQGNVEPLQCEDTLLSKS